MQRKSSVMAKKRRLFRAPPQVTLSNEWRAWIVENAVAGVSLDELVQTLVAAEIPKRLALREVSAILESPALPGCTKLHNRTQRLELALSLVRSQHATSAHADTIERREMVAADEFFEQYYAANRPVVITKMLDAWPALTKWTPEYFAAQVGHVEIEVVAGRDADPDCDRHLDRHRQTMLMADYCRLVRERGVTNDIYLVSGNRVFEQPEFAPLLADLTPPAEFFDVPVRPGTASLWFGPAGTVTPLHHDVNNIMICQIYGRKRIQLIAPWSTCLLSTVEGYYARRDWKTLVADEEHPISVRTVELTAGEALFLPVGYWHEVEALEPSIHVSMLGFRRPNASTWYKPGFVGV